MNSDDYEQFVGMLARNGLDMGESPRTIARTSIIAADRVGDEQAILLSAEPFVDEPAKQTRLWPKDVINGTNRDWSHTNQDTLRDLAVEILKVDLHDAMMGIENDTVRPWSQI